MANSPFEIKTNEVPLFNTSEYKNGKFYCTAKISYSIDKINRRYTVTIEGVRGYCYYRWNFAQNISMWLSSKSDGSNSTKSSFKFAAPGKIKNGAINGKPYIPDNFGYPSGVTKLSKTFSYNKDGTPKPCYFYLRDYNLSIYNVVNGKTTYADVSVLKDISTYIPSIPADDARPPVIYENSYSLYGTYVDLELEADSDITNWECKFDGTKQTGGYGNSKYYFITSHVKENKKDGKITVTATKWNNEKATWTKLYDTTIPVVSPKYKITKVDKATISFSNKDYKIGYTIIVDDYKYSYSSKNGDYRKEWEVPINLTSNKVNNVKIKVFRGDNQGLIYECPVLKIGRPTKFTCTCDPKIRDNEYATFTVTNNTEGGDLYFKFSTDLTKVYGPLKTGKSDNVGLKVPKNKISNIKIIGYQKSIEGSEVEKSIPVNTIKPVLSFILPDENNKNTIYKGTSNNASVSIKDFDLTMEGNNKPSCKLQIFDESGQNIKTLKVTKNTSSIDFNIKFDKREEYTFKCIAESNNCYTEHREYLNSKKIDIENLNVESYGSKLIVKFKGTINSKPINEGFFKYEIDVLNSKDEIIKTVRFNKGTQSLGNTYFNAGTNIVKSIPLDESLVGSKLDCIVRAYAVSNLEGKEGTRVNNITTSDRSKNPTVFYPTILIGRVDENDQYYNNIVVAHIYKDGKWNLAIPHIYKNGEWKK